MIQDLLNSPLWPIVAGGARVNGGIIRSINVVSLGTSLTFTIPGALVALTPPINGPCAPDYGFKIYPLY